MPNGRGVFLLLTAVLLLALAVCPSCRKAEKIGIPPVPEEPAVLSQAGDEGSGDDPQIFVVEIDSFCYRDSVTAVPIQVYWSPGPEELLVRLQDAYNQRDADLFISLLADDYVCTEITPDGMDSWGKQQEILVHQRMFDPDYGFHPISSIQLMLDNVTATPLDLTVWEHELWLLTCDAHLILEYADPDHDAFQFLGPAEFHVRRNLALQCAWELVEWHDQLPEGE